MWRNWLEYVHGFYTANALLTNGFPNVQPVPRPAMLEVPACVPTSTTPSASKSDYVAQRAPPESDLRLNASPGTSNPTSSSSPPSSTPLPGNPYVGANVYLSPYYASEVEKAATMISDSSLKAKAASVANIATFIWLDVVAKVPTLETYLKEAEASKQLLQIIVYDLPDRDCAALASNGEFSVADDGVAKYKNYIDQIAAAIASE